MNANNKENKENMDKSQNLLERVLNKEKTTKDTSQEKKNNEYFTLYIDSNTDGYYNIQRFFIKEYTKKNSFNTLRLDTINKNKNKIQYQLPIYTKIEIEYEGETISIEKKPETDYKSCSTITRLYRLIVSAKTKEIIEKLLLKSKEEDCNVQIIRYYDVKYGFWGISEDKKKSCENLIFEDDFKENFVKDITNFNQSEKIYEKYEMPYKRNYMLYGVPGAGKTSFIKGLAGMLNRDLYILTFDVNTTNDILNKAITSIHNKNAILLLEDIDCLFIDRNAVEKTKVSFSALLNILDGVRGNAGLITMMTTNHIDRLDPALLRPGRVDMMLKFEFIKKDQICKFMKLYDINISDNIINEISSICSDKKLSASILSGFLFNNLLNKLSDKNIIKSFKKYLKKMGIKSESNLDMYN